MWFYIWRREVVSRTKPVIVVTTRLPVDLKDWLDEQAKQNMRSRHGEMMHILESARKRKEIEKCEA